MPQPGENHGGRRDHLPHPGTISVREAGYCDRDIALLDVMRLFFMAFAEPGRQAWEVAFERCETYFGAEHAGTVGFATLRTIKAMRVSRKTVFRFSSPFCPCCRDRVTDCERNMLGVIRALSLGDGATARANALVLCEGFPADDFLYAAEALVVSSPAAGSAGLRH